MARDSQEFSSPQEAIEGYLEALLQDVAEYDEPATSSEHQAEPDAVVSEGTVSENQIASEQENSRISALRSEVAGGEALTPKDDVTEDEPDGTRIFAPPSAREYAREAATKIRQRQKLVDLDVPKVDLAYQDVPRVVMPELQVAPVEAETKVEIPVSVAPVVEPQLKTETLVEAEPVNAEPVVVKPIENLHRDTLQTEQDVAQQTVALKPVENEGWSNGRPDWAQGRFECLLFVVKGLKLAVPLAELGGIHKLEKAPTPLFGQPGWFLGIVRTNNMNVGLVDTAQWVMSEHIKDNHKPDFRFAIRIHNSEWGLACHEVAEAISLDPDEVKWRTSLGKRPWLAGTVVDHMCALIDVAAFARLLDSDKVPVDLQALMADEE